MASLDYIRLGKSGYTHDTGLWVVLDYRSEHSALCLRAFSHIQTTSSLQSNHKHLLV